MPSKLSTKLLICSYSWGSMASPISGASVSLAIFTPAIITTTDTAMPTMPSMFTPKMPNTAMDSMVAEVVTTSPMASAAVASITLELIRFPSVLLNSESQSFTATLRDRITMEIHLKDMLSGFKILFSDVLNRENPT